ncbi:unnamed protein product [Caenorhabditis bovis]|uniref:RING-type E3 ubiquitin transferase n=1 Tax=Caenorhabditis bovis TaxID=2654633 RepID=A0A8S1ENU7_9PELO|nr:unnamed protein product [Caenorhabditis bovis]
MEAAKKKYGLVLKKDRMEPVLKKIPRPSVFEDDDDDDSTTAPTSTNKASASVIRVQKAAEREHQKAQAEDPSIFDYDASYDEIQAIKNEKKEEQKQADQKRESKYAAAIIKAHARRQLENFSREERQQLREREKEGDEFADKEVFVTGAYRKQQEEVKKFREIEAEEALFNDMTSVQKQKLWEVGIGRTLLNDISRDPTQIMQRKKEKTNLRARKTSENDEGDETKADDVETKKKSIYSDDEEDNGPPAKNFEGDLKPGLNKVVKKATTKAERIQRNFTPTPPSSDDEGVGRRRRSRSSERNRRDRGRSREVKKEEEDEDVKPNSRDIRKLSLKEKLKPKKIDRAERLKGLKAILKQRNGPEEIEAMRQRYLERKESRMVMNVSQSAAPPNGGASSSNEKKEDDGRFECNICLDSAKDPVVSMCGHLFCWPCLSQWIDMKPNHPLCPVCKSSISAEKVVPIYGKSGDSADPRQKVPPRPKGQRSEAPPTSFPGFQWGGADGGGGVHFSFGIGIFPLSFLATWFNPPAERRPDAPRPGSRQLEEEEHLNNIFKYLAFIFIFWLLFV